jgi:hypothetical protein
MIRSDLVDHLKTLVYFHLEEQHSAQHLLQALEQDDFARNQIAPKDGFKKSSFLEATNCRGLNSFSMFLKIYKSKQLSFCLKSIRNLVI